MTPPIRAMVVDDEPLARVNLRSLLASESAWQLVGEWGSGAAALQGITKDPPDVVFLDIRMPGLDGLEVARRLSDLEPRPLVVFATAFDDHALDAFAVEAADYLVKPIDRGRFVTTVRRLERRLRGAVSAAPTGRQAPVAEEPVVTPVADDVETGPVGPATAASRRLAVRSVGRVRLVAVDDIHWLGAAGNYVRLYLAESCYLHRATLTALERQLPSELFLRIHRSTMVNRRQVVELRTSVAGRYQLVLRDGTELEISQRFKQRVFSALVPS